MTNAPGTLGILNPLDGLSRFALERLAPPADLAPFVERHWVVRWDLRGLPPFEQETLPHPNVNMAFEAHRSAVHGVGTERFVARLEGQGRVVGTKFTPGGFFAFSGAPVASITDRVVPVAELFGEAGERLSHDVLSCADHLEAVALIEAFLRRREPRADEPMRLACSLVKLCQANRDIATADDLAREGGLSVRSLHRLFARYVGVGPKWVVRRARVQEAAERAAAGEAIDWASLAFELGYCDQAHFIRDFKAQIGQTPAAYGARCAVAARRAS